MACSVTARTLAGATAHRSATVSPVRAPRGVTCAISASRPLQVDIRPLTCTVTASFERWTVPLKLRPEPCAPS